MQTAIILLTPDQLTEIVEKAVYQGASLALNSIKKNEAISINQLIKEKQLGGYKKIKSLIKTGLIKQLPDGKISRNEIEVYLNKSM